jgi:tRNA threonylcarbamoyl adenosine modification protein (Sua5/YciO/YrdC/YwlC family)
MTEVTSNDSSTAQLARAVVELQRGGIVAFPTETFYGLAVDPFCRSALVALFELKKRAADKPILVLIDHIEQLSQLVKSIPQQYVPLMERHWPGPLTLIFPAKKSLPVELTGGTGTIGVRISSHPLAEDWCEPPPHHSRLPAPMSPAPRRRRPLKKWRRCSDHLYAISLTEEKPLVV